MNTIIKIQVKEVYGNGLIYIVSEHKEFISALTGRKTIHQGDINNLKALGFSFEVQTQTIKI